MQVNKGLWGTMIGTQYLQSNHCCCLFTWDAQQEHDFGYPILFSCFYIFLHSHFKINLLAIFVPCVLKSFQLSPFIYLFIYNIWNVTSRSKEVILPLYSHETPPGVLCLVLEPPAQEGHGVVGAGPEERQRWSEGWRTSPTRAGWKKWGSSAWKRESSEETL